MADAGARGDAAVTGSVRVARGAQAHNGIDESESANFPVGAESVQPDQFSFTPPEGAQTVESFSTDALGELVI